MAKNIQDLRKEAGYSSAKDFAAALNIPQSTYARYENQPEGIPLKQAWAIADFLGCSIDMIVGREPVNVEDMRGDVQKFYDDLAADNRYLMDEYMRFIGMREEVAKRKKREAEERQYREYAEYYERLFLQQAESNAAFGDMVVFGTQTDSRKQFEDFITARAKAKRESDLSQDLIEYEIMLSDGGQWPVYDEEGELIGIDEDGPIDNEEELSRLIEERRKSLTAEWEKRDEEVIAKIMVAYDKLHSDRSGFTEYYYTTIEYTGDQG